MALKKVTRGCNKNFKRFDTTSSFVFQTILPRFPLFLRKNAQNKYFAKIPTPAFSQKKSRRRNILPRFLLPPFRRKNPQNKYFAEIPTPAIS
jgi:hypothetical protein